MSVDAEEFDEVEKLKFQGEVGPILGAEPAKRIAKDGDFTLAALHGETDEFRARKIVKIAETFKDRAKTSTWSERLAVISGIAAAMVLIIQARRRLQDREKE